MLFVFICNLFLLGRSSALWFSILGIGCFLVFALSCSWLGRAAGKLVFAELLSVILDKDVSRLVDVLRVNLDALVS